MPLPDLTIIGLLPAVIWVSVVFVARSTAGFASKLRAAWSAKTKQDLIEGAKSWALFGQLVFLIVLIGVVIWARIQGPNQLSTLLSPSRWKLGVFLGIISGLVLTGLLQILRGIFPEARRFSLLVMAGIASPPLVRVSALLIVAFTEELWRAVCLNSATAAGVPGPQALLATSIGYCLAYATWGTPTAFSEGLVGAALGGLFVWSHSFLVPFTAHVILQGQVLLYALAAAPDAEPSALNRRPFTKCPACGAGLNLRQVNLNFNEAFFCPNCHTRLTSSDRRRGFFRWGIAVVTTAILFTSWEFFPDIMRGNNYWISLAVIPLSGIGLLSILQVVFPLQLEFGDPDFVGLNLKDQGAVRSEQEKAKEPERDSK
jgi:hypothetical protein